MTHQPKQKKTREAVLVITSAKWYSVCINDSFTKAAANATYVNVIIEVSPLKSKYICYEWNVYYC